MSTPGQVAAGLFVAMASGVGAVVLASRIEAYPIALALQCAALVLVVIMGWRTGARAPQRSALAAVSDAKQDRRRPGIDRMSGLCAPWYFRMRLEEESARCERYQLQFCLVRISSESTETMNFARRVMPGELNVVQIPGDFGEMIAVLMPHTTREGGLELVDRLRSALPAATFVVAEYPADASNLGEMLGQHAWDTHDLPGMAAA